MSDTTETGGTSVELAGDLEGLNVAPDPPEDDAAESIEQAEPGDDAETRGMPAGISRRALR